MKISGIKKVGVPNRWDFYSVIVIRICQCWSLVLALLLSAPLYADQNEEAWPGKVVAVHDGDTIRVRFLNRVHVIRLKGIDTPEVDQPYGEEATRFVRKEALGQNITLKVFGLDKYNRVLAEVILPFGRNLNQELVREGLAWRHKRYSQDPILKSLESQARKMRRGLWADDHPVAPWTWKRQTKK
ncbi:MAG: thermonuclease family protein [Nitrospirae bacterium]|nr:thermonuclease family protein [Magnetococcales bacterium]HAT51088.1 nuclease [Alphaproteobacteria bacterium]